MKAKSNTRGFSREMHVELLRRCQPFQNIENQPLIAKHSCNTLQCTSNDHHRTNETHIIILGPKRNKSNEVPTLSMPTISDAKSCSRINAASSIVHTHTHTHTNTHTHKNTHTHTHTHTNTNTCRVLNKEVALALLNKKNNSRINTAPHGASALERQGRGIRIEKQHNKTHPSALEHSITRPSAAGRHSAQEDASDRGSANHSGARSAPSQPS